MDTIAKDAADQQIDFIYFDPEHTDYHPGHIRIFAERADADPRIRSMHFVLSPGLAREGHASVLDTIRAGKKLSLEFCSDEIAQVSKPDAGLSSRERGKVRWDEARRLLTARPGAVVYDTPFDNTLAAAALDRRPLPGKLTGIVFSCSTAIFSPSLVTRLKLSAKYLLARRPDIPVVFTFDQVFMERGPRAIVSGWKAAPDPLPLTPAQLQRLMTAPLAPVKDRVEFLLFGAIAPHKGIHEVLQALREMAPETAARTRVRFLGKFGEGGAVAREAFVADIASTLAATRAEIIFDECFATEDDLIDAMIRCDVMLATRRHHAGVSHNMIWAAAAGRPIISQDTSWMGHITKQESLGLVCDPLDPKAIAAVMTQLVDPAWRAAFKVAGPRAFSSTYTADGYYETVITALAGPRPQALAVAAAA